MITRIEIEKQEFFADGYEFPNTGPYERLCGSAYGEVDPKSRLNVQLHARAARGASSCKPLFGGTRA